MTGKVQAIRRAEASIRQAVSEGAVSEEDAETRVGEMREMIVDQ